MTQRKKQGVAMMIGHGVGVVVGLIVFATTSTPAVVPVIVGAVIAIASSWLGYTIIPPDIPE